MEAESPTVKLYSESWLVLEGTCTILQVITSNEDAKKFELILDQTPFHAQGGGQPCDIGTITAVGGGPVFKVKFVSIRDGIIRHAGEFDLPEGEVHSFAVGQTVQTVVEKRRRVVSTKLHSFGHLLDSALDRLGWGTRLIPGKGYHFEDSPYVEYKAASGVTISTAELEELPSLLNAEVARLIGLQIPTTIETQTREEAAVNCRMDLTGYPELVRVVSLGGLAIPCGGTHVINTAELGQGWSIGKIKKKKDAYRLPYSCSTLYST